MPAEARDPAARAGEADGKLRQTGRGRAREKVAQMGFDGVGFGEGHSEKFPSAMREIRSRMNFDRASMAASETVFAEISSTTLR